MSVVCSPAFDNLAGIEECIENDRANGKEEQIDHVRIDNRIASLAYLEGKIPKATFDAAEEKEDYIQIIILLAGKEYTVRIYPESIEMPEGTYTADGKIV